MESSSDITSPLTDGLHLEVLSDTTKKAFLKCVSSSFFSSGGWYLAGGTSLALQVGHRRSVDLDFFTPEYFDEKKIEETLSKLGDWKTTSIDRGTVYGELDQVKISLIAYPFIKFSKLFLKIGAVSLVRPEDIAVMKIVAISQRGKKRDFFDLYWISLNIQDLTKSIESAQDQYQIKQNLTHVLKSLVYFQDAEDDPTPDIYFKATWKEVKSFFIDQIPKITRDLVDLK